MTKIVWKSVTETQDEWTGALGHGVEFSHKSCPGVIIAFLVGYAWLHEPDSMESIVEVRSSPPEGSGVDVSEWNAIVDEVRGAALHLIAHQAWSEPCPAYPAVGAHFNA